MNGKQLGKFSSTEDGRKLKYMQSLKGFTFLTHPVLIKNPYFFHHLLYRFGCERHNYVQAEK